MYLPESIVDTVRQWKVMLMASKQFAKLPPVTRLKVRVLYLPIRCMALNHGGAKYTTNVLYVRVVNYESIGVS